jgi:hypothetical protein
VASETVAGSGYLSPKLLGIVAESGSKILTIKYFKAVCNQGGRAMFPLRNKVVILS